MDRKDRKQKARVNQEQQEQKQSAIGRPRKFPTEESFQQAFINYVEHCNSQDPKRIPNVAGFCVYCDMVRDTYYIQEDCYSDTFKKIQLAFEDQHLNIKDTIRSIFLLKAVHGYRDSDPPQSAITVNYQGVTDKQLEAMYRIAGLVEAPKSEDEE
jgi:hypothetical protein